MLFITMCLYYRLEGDSFVQFKAMVMTTSMHLMLLVFDILACDNLETNNHSWMFVFIPLMFMSIVSIGFCVWAIKNERSFEVRTQEYENCLRMHINIDFCD